MSISTAVEPQRAFEARAVEREMEHVFALLSDRRIEGEARVKLKIRGSQLRAQYRELIRGR
jgi:hypothetical protein